jgi:dihydrofolate reductase
VTRVVFAISVSLDGFLTASNVRPEVPMGDDGVEPALQQARAAGDKNVVVMGGATLGQQYIRAGLVDEIQLHLVPVLFGSGSRMFEHLGGGHVHLEVAEVLEAPEATHLRYRVVKREGAA